LQSFFPLQPLSLDLQPPWPLQGVLSLAVMLAGSAVIQVAQYGAGIERGRAGAGAERGVEFKAALAWESDAAGQIIRLPLQLPSLSWLFFSFLFSLGYFASSQSDGPGRVMKRAKG